MKAMLTISCVLMLSNAAWAADNESLIEKVVADLNATDFRGPANATTTQSDAYFQKQIGGIKRKYDGQTIQLKLMIKDVRAVATGGFQVTVEGGHQRIPITLTKKQAQHVAAGDVVLISGKVSLHVVKNGGAVIEGKDWYTLDKCRIPNSSTAVWVGISPWKVLSVKRGNKSGG
ncbi:MAG: hypothetical protein K8T25_12690 [Planctomycetia bacterium]|nr:hypothetical protein [Planctomycetia bacterium]